MPVDGCLYCTEPGRPSASVIACIAAVGNATKPVGGVAQQMTVQFERLDPFIAVSIATSLICIKHL